jgi:CubicO group peptidase (beta-lactamase class C family)
MKRTIILLMLTVVVSTACIMNPTQTPYSRPTKDSESFIVIRKHIESLVADGEVPSMAIAVARDGTILWEEAFGFANKENNVPATSHTPYPLASISKPLTATALMILVERNLINLDDPINRYIDDFDFHAHLGTMDEVTLRRIASHTAGLPLHAQFYYEGEPTTPPAINETIRRYAHIITAPGERFQYSNLGYGMLGYVIAHSVDQDMESRLALAEFLQNDVFIPLGMDDTLVYLKHDNGEEFASKYTPDGRLVSPSISDCPGASDIYSSVHDLIRFAMFHLQNEMPYQEKIINNASIDEMQIPSPETIAIKSWEHDGSGYGIGWFIGVTADGLRVIYHDGGILGASTVLALIPEENIAVAVLSNTNSQFPDQILIETICTLLGRKVDEFLPHSDYNDDEVKLNLPHHLYGWWRGYVHTHEGEIPLGLNIDASGEIYVALGEYAQGKLLEEVSYQKTNYTLFMNAGGGPFLRGKLWGNIEVPDVERGQPTSLWLELQLHQDALNGVLIAFSQRQFYTGPLSFQVELTRQ